jgi:hypothetical protein
MKRIAFVFGSILLFAATAGAQADSGSPLPVTTPAPESTSTAPATGTTYAFVPATASPFSGALSATAAPTSSSAASSDSAAQQAPGVQGVFQTYNWQAYFGYTFFRFYVVPKFTDDMNGLNLGIVYYPGGRWFGADGEFIGTWGSSIGSNTTKFVAGMGGGRVRWSAPKDLEVWGHGLVGISNLLPQTALGKQSAFVYELGAGVDLNVLHSHWAIRVSGDMIGTHYFNAYQYSPKISAGIVFKY